jgi:hypothetical protein
MRRAMLVMQGFGPEDPYYPYDHPYFGQIFLAGVLALIDYPQSLHPLPNLQSIEMLYLVPRLLMGLLAVLDTFLLYKIAEYRHGRKVALFSSVIFAVMPLSWILRRVYLDSILLPFLLASILLAVYIKRKSSNEKVHVRDSEANSIDSSAGVTTGNHSSINIHVPILISGILLGLAIYTKIPAFTMLPLVGYLVYRNSNKNLKALGLWLLPVILIPAMWPMYSISVGEFNEWMQGVLWQGTQRGSAGITDIKVSEFFRADPVLLILGGVGIVLCGLRKDMLYLLWTIPCIVFFVLVGWVILFHWIPLLPAFCIGVGVAIDQLTRKISEKKVVYKILQSTVILAIVVFGFISTTTLITTNFSSSEFEAAAFVSTLLQIQKYENTNQTTQDNGPLLITSPIYSWIFKYVFDKDLVSSHIRDPAHAQTGKKILMADGVYQSFISKEDLEDREQFNRIQSLYDNSNTLAKFDTDESKYKAVKNFYPFNSIIGYSWSKPIIVKGN